MGGIGYYTHPLTVHLFVLLCLLCQLLTADDEISYSRVTRKMACLHAKGKVMVITLSPLVTIMIPFLSCSVMLPLERFVILVYRYWAIHRHNVKR